MLLLWLVVKNIILLYYIDFFDDDVGSVAVKRGIITSDVECRKGKTQSLK
jgi:hypothetical protein